MEAIPTWGQLQINWRYHQHIFKIQGSQSSSQVYFYTQAFSTVNKPYVNLEFHHIAKLFAANNASIELSTDSGVTWISLDGSHYEGNDPSLHF
ncbi:MAG: hypothetical protein U5L96_04045 [Owenweeksia sp.]|nr:hypothetical protein [Owenweeksia sp.]